MNRKRLALAGRVFISVFLVAFMALGAYAFYLNVKADELLEAVPRGDLMPSRTPAPTPSEAPSEEPPQEPARALNYVLMGVDSRGGDDPGRSDSLMVAHLPAARKHAYLISIPRDTYAEIPGHTKQKINAAYSLGGPPLTVRTVENLFGVTIDHAAQVNFRGFMRIVEAVGGVTVDNPHEVCDTSQNICWKKGPLTLDRDTALKYVRTRHGLPNGDLDRAANQQRVLKAIAAKTLSKETLANPGRLMEILTELTKHVVVDKDLTSSEMKDTLLSLRFTSSGDLRSLTIPIKGFENLGALGDVDLVDEEAFALLKKALQEDTMDAYWSLKKP